MSEMEKHPTGDDTQHSDGTNGQPRKSWGKRKIGWLIIIFILIIVALTIFIWKEIEVNRYSKDLDRQAAYYQAELKNNLDHEREHFLKLIMKPLVWAIRTEMIDEDFSQINQYLTNFVQKEENAQLLLVVDAEGTIISATDKKLQDSEFSRNYDAAYLENNDVKVEPLDENRFMVTAPVVNFNSRIGTLVLVYRSNEYQLEYQRN